MGLKERNVRRGIINQLTENYGYSPDQIVEEVRVTEGAIIDAIIYTDGDRISPLIVIEIKRHLVYPMATYQLEHYMKLTQAKYGLLTNGEIKFCFQLVGDRIFKIPDIPKKGESEREILLKSDLKLKTGFGYSIQKIGDRLKELGLDRERITKETQKLLICKFYDEQTSEKEVRFWISPKEMRIFGDTTVKGAFYKRITSLFEDVKKAYPGLYSRWEKLELAPQTLSFVVAELQDYSFLSLPVESFSEIYQDFIIKNLRGFLGEYSTSKTLAKFMVELLDPAPHENILDPACGTGRFLIESMVFIQNKMEVAEVMKSEHPGKKTFGFDISPEMVVISKINMILHGDGHANIFEHDSLLPLNKIRGLFPLNFDLIITDPPVRGHVYDKKILQDYTLGRSRRSQRILVLFLEKCLRILNFQGRLAIIVPDALLSSTSLGYVRKFIRQNSILDAIISLPLAISFSESGVKSSILFLRKAFRDQKVYNVFMGIVDAKNEDSMKEIVEQYSKFLKREKSSSDRTFVTKSSQLGRRWDVNFHRSEESKISNTKTLRDLCEVISGSRVSSSKYLDYHEKGSIPYIRISDIVDGELIKSGMKFVKSDIQKSRVQVVDVLFSVRGTIGKTAIVPKTFEKSIASSQIAILRPKTGLVYPKFLSKILSSEAVLKQIEQVKIAQFIPYLSLDDLRHLQIPYCSLEDQIDIVDRIDQFEKDSKRLSTKKKEIDNKIREILSEVGL